MLTMRNLAALLTPTEAARFKDMTLNHFKYHLKNDPSAPRPVLVGRFRHAFYREDDLKAWKPKLRTKEAK